jgi:hypothetical protein
VQARKPNLTNAHRHTHKVPHPHTPPTHTHDSGYAYVWIKVYASSMNNNVCVWTASIYVNSNTHLDSDVCMQTYGQRCMYGDVWLHVWKACMYVWITKWYVCQCMGKCLCMRMYGFMYGRPICMYGAPNSMHEHVWST